MNSVRRLFEETSHMGGLCLRLLSLNYQRPGQGTRNIIFKHPLLCTETRPLLIEKLLNEKQDNA